MSNTFCIVEDFINYLQVNDYSFTVIKSSYVFTSYELFNNGILNYGIRKEFRSMH